MKKLQENKLSMFRMVENTCMDFESDWAEIKPFSAAMNSLRRIIKQIKDERQLQEENYTGITQKRKEITTKLITMTMKFSSVLKDYAVVHNDTVLYKKIAIPKSALIRSRDTILEDKCLFVYNKSKMLEEELSSYGFVDRDFDEYNRLIKKYSNTLLSSKEAINYRKIATKKISELIKSGNALLNDRLDNLIVLFQDVNPDFCDAYENSRKMIRSGMKSRSKTEGFQENLAA